jgi:hypothetical protein
MSVAAEPEHALTKMANIARYESRFMAPPTPTAATEVPICDVRRPDLQVGRKSRLIQLINVIFTI